MTSDADRQFARQQAQRRQQFHVERGDADYMIADNIDGVEVNYRGFLGECAFVEAFGGAVDISLRPGGDGGRDFLLPLAMDCGTVRRFVVDVKVFAHDGPTTRLLVPVDRIKREVIYIAAHYSVVRDDAALRCWAWGVELVRANDVRVFNGRGVKNYTLLYGNCRRLYELTDRVPSARLAIKLNRVPDYIMGRWL